MKIKKLLRVALSLCFAFGLTVNAMAGADDNTYLTTKFLRGYTTKDLYNILIDFESTNLLYFLLDGTRTITGATTISDTTESTTSLNGALIVSGGVGIAKKLNLTGDLLLQDGADLYMSTGLTGLYGIYLKDGQADALSIIRGSTDMMVFNTSTPLITITPATTITGLLTANGGINIVGTTGMSITGVTNTNNALIIGADGTSSGDFIIYGQVAGSYMQYDSTMTGDNKGRLIVANSSARFTCANSLNVCALSATQTVDSAQAGTGGAHGIWSTCTLSAYEMTSTSYTHYAGVHGDAIINATLNGDEVHVYGVLGEIRGTGTQTTANVIAAVAAKYNNAVTLGAGDSCLYWGWSHTGVVDYGLLLEATGSGSITTGISVGACTDHQINITDVWGVGITGGAIVIGDYSNPIAFGEVTEHLVGLCVNLSASTDDASNLIAIHGKLTTTADCGANAVAQAMYGRVDIAHDINGSYGVRGAITMTGTPAVHQAYALFGTVAMTACTISGTGGYIAALALEVTGSTDVTGDGKVCGSRISWVQTNAMTVETVGSMIAVNTSTSKLDSGFRIDTGGTLTNAFYSYNTSGTVTTGLRIDGAHTNAFAFPAIGTAPVAEYTTEEAPTGKIKIQVGGETRYLAYWD